MSALFARTAIALVIAVTAAGAAEARTVKISGTHTREEIRSTCAKVGGVGSGTTAPSGPYSCDNLDKGTSVTCDAQGHCTGWVPK